MCIMSYKLIIDHLKHILHKTSTVGLGSGGILHLNYISRHLVIKALINIPSAFSFHASCFPLSKLPIN